MPRIYQYDVVAEVAAPNIGSAWAQIWAGGSKIDLVSIREVVRASIHQPMTNIELGLINFAELIARCWRANFEVAAIAPRLRKVMNYVNLTPTDHYTTLIISKPNFGNFTGLIRFRQVVRYDRHHTTYWAPLGKLFGCGAGAVERAF